MTTPAKQVDVEITTWIAEFFLRQPGSVALKFLKNPVIPLSNENPLLKKTIMLKSIEDLIDDASISEVLLDFLENIASLNFAVSHSMRAAYCAVAVDCTVKYLAAGGEVGKQKYFEAVKRIWRERIGKLEEKESELVSDELRSLREEIEAAIWDDNAGMRFVEKNTRNEALRLVRVYLNEANLGSSFLESVAKMQLQGKQRLESDREREDPVFDITGVDVDNVVDEASKSGKETALLTSSEEEMIGRREGRGDVGDGGSGGDIENLELGVGNEERFKGYQVADSNVHPDTTAADAGLRKVSVEVIQKRTTHREEEYTSNSKHSRRHVRIVDSPETDIDMVNDKNDEHTNPKASKKDLLVEMHDKNKKAPIEIIDTEDMDINASSDKRNDLSTPAVEKVVESLKCSHKELQKVVQDPLPDTLKVSETVVAEMAGKNSSNFEREKQREDVDPCTLSANPSAEALQSKPNVGTSGQHDAVPKRSLMDRNSTAHTVEWDDSIEESPETSPIKNRPRLVSIRRTAVSPIKKVEHKTVTKRRKFHRWTQEEEDALIDGVKRFGKGNWKVILNAKRDVFTNRTEVDLKDKWRNLLKEH